jgi:energy-coupling factor transporter ATP-binding protein EcfA2
LARQRKSAVSDNDPARDEPYKVWFGYRARPIPNLVPSGIHVSPVNSGWNDFGFEIHCRFEIVGLKGLEYFGDLKLGFLDEGQDLPTVLKKKLDLDNTRQIAAEELPEFFSILPEMKDYRSIVRALGTVEARKVLEAVHDLVAIRHYRVAQNWVEEARKSEIFALAFMRANETFYAFHNAGPILDGLQEERLAGISEYIELEFKLDAFRNKHNLKLQFDLDGIVPGRICVLIGKNGLGKSQALSKLVQQMVIGSEGVDRSSSEFVRLVDRQGKRPLVNRLLAIGTPGETANTFPAEPIVPGRVLYRRLLLTRGSRRTYAKGFGDLAKQLARSTESIANRSRWSIFLDAVRSNLPQEQIAVPVRKDADISLNLPIIRAGNSMYIALRSLSLAGEQASLELWGILEERGDPVRILEDKVVPLSSGQLAFLQFAAQACLFIENGTLVLVDEPETHLHPNLIADFVELLDRLLQLTGSIAILATHSAYFVREVRRSQVLVFRDIESQIAIDKPRLKTFGADVGSISFFVFEDDVVNRLVKKVKVALANDDNPAARIEELQGELSSEVLMSLKREFQLE